MRVEPPGPVSPAVFAWRVVKLVATVTFAWLVVPRYLGGGGGPISRLIVLGITASALTDAVLHVLNQPSIEERVAVAWVRRFPPQADEEAGPTRREP